MITNDKLTDKELAQLTIRAQNACRKLNATTYSKFLALTEDVVRQFKNAGEQTWQSIQQLQNHIKNDQQRERSQCEELKGT